MITAILLYLFRNHCYVFYFVVLCLNFEYELVTEVLFSNLSLQFFSGWISIVGANGTGKTTLLKLLSGKLKPDSGLVSCSGKIE